MMIRKNVAADGDIQIFEEQDILFIKAVDPINIEAAPVELNSDEAIELGKKIIELAKEIKKREEG